MPFFNKEPDNKIYLSREDDAEALSAYSAFTFELDGAKWPTVEHYYQAMKFDDAALQEKIRAAETPAKAAEEAKVLIKMQKGNWSKLKDIVMTRAIYIKCRTHDAVAAKLLDTGDALLVESSLYDYYWGCGRDGRGENRFGKILQNVRAKLKEEATQ